MRRLLLCSILLLLPGCAELDPLGVETPSYAASVAATVPQPVITSAAADGDNITVLWEWSDLARGWARVTFDVSRNGAGLGIAIRRSEPYDAGLLLRRGIIDVPGNGSYTYCVNVHAFEEVGQPAAASASTCADVTLGPAHDIVITGGNAARGRLPRNAANLTLEYELHAADEVVTDCTFVPDIAIDPAAQLLRHTCDDDDGRRTLVIRNPARGTPTEFLVSFHLYTLLLELPISSM